jgi:hypothetical protein
LLDHDEQVEEERLATASSTATAGGSGPKSTEAA